MKYFLSFLFILPTALMANGPCGKEGTIDERIKNCNLAKENFALVLRDEKGLEVYQDTKTGYLWSDRISIDFNHYGSQKACSNELMEASLLSNVDWQLPSVREFEMAASHGMKGALPRMFHTFWTSTPVKASYKVRRRRTYTAQAFLWNGQDERTETGDLKDAASVRCLGRVK